MRSSRFQALQIVALLLAAFTGSRCEGYAQEARQYGPPTSQQTGMRRLPPVETQPPARRKLMVGLPVAVPDGAGAVLQRPNVAFNVPQSPNIPQPLISKTLSTAADVVWPDDQVPLLHRAWHRLFGSETYELAETSVASPELRSGLPSSLDPAHFQLSSFQATPEELPRGIEGAMVEEFAPGSAAANLQVAEPIFQFDEGHNCRLWFCPRCGALGRFFGFGQHSGAEDIGIGHERVIWAISEIEPTQPLNNFRIRIDSAYNLERPDRAEYFWSKPGLPKGPPLSESLVDYQELRFLMEVGDKKFSVLTELPLRIVDPVRNNNSAGLGDVSVGTKLVILTGKKWQITQITRTYMNTSVSRRGLGSGHFSLEPGLLFRYKINDRTYLHKELKFWIPLGADLDHAGEVLRMGIGISHVWYETDTFAILPTLELVGWSVLDGLETPPIGLPVEIDPEGIFNIHPGVRFVADTDCDLGLFELGLSSSISASSNRWYESLFRVDLRWSY